jgi:uncharacterized membrane protein YdbT with pleckstrin-like domain
LAQGKIILSLGEPQKINFQTVAGKIARHLTRTSNDTTMEEEIIWKGSPSQWTNVGLFISCILIVPIPFALWAYLKTKNRVFTITSERVIKTTGVFSKTTDEMELYRVKDLKVLQPFSLRLVNLSNIVMNTSDRTHSVVVIPAIVNGMDVKEQLRKAVEARRDLKKVRETDFE